jgi:alginate O-acetyltransferase complex protein AlgI
MIAELAAERSDQALVGSWLAAVLFLFRLYYDLSGCFDMAQGLAKMFGFRLPDSFRQPFMALSVTDFFSRWNLTVGSFFRDYVEQPLRGKRAAASGRYLALAVSMALMGFVYGGSLNFLLWGVLFAAVLIVEEMYEEFLTDLPNWLRRILTLLALVVGFVLFMHPDVEGLGNALKAMIGNGGFSVRGDGDRIQNCIPLLGGCLFGVTDLPKQFRLGWRKVCGLSGGKTAPKPALVYVYIASFALYVVWIMFWCTVSRVGWELIPSVFLSM